MEIEKNELVVLNEDQKAVAVKSLKDLYFAVSEMHTRLLAGELDVEMKDTLFSLFESYVSEASKVIGYDSNASKAIAEKHDEIRKANQQIHELEEKLANNTQVDGLTKLMYAMHTALYDWWKIQGFNLVTDDSFGVYGYKARFCLDTRHISFMSRHPVTEKRNQKSKLEKMIEEGYEFILEDGDEYVLLDNENNRQKIINLLKSKFPSSDIICWSNWCVHKTDKFRLKDFECYIRDLSEMKQVIEEMKNVDVDADK